MTEDFRQQYKEEARQVLKSLEQSLLQLEKTPDLDELNNAYRYLHTLKGSAGMFDFFSIERLAHELESVYASIRTGARTVDGFIIDLTFRAIDVFAELIEEREAESEVAAIIAELQHEGTAQNSQKTDSEVNSACY